MQEAQKSLLSLNEMQIDWDENDLRNTNREGEADLQPCSLCNTNMEGQLTCSHMVCAILRERGKWFVPILKNHPLSKQWY